MARTTRRKALVTEAAKHGYVLVKQGDRTPKATVKEAAPIKAAKLPVWAFGPDARQARYDSQPNYWVKPASKAQRERCGKLPAKATAKDAAECYAKLMQEANGMAFKPLR